VAFGNQCGQRYSSILGFIWQEKMLAKTCASNRSSAAKAIDFAALFLVSMF
jgi:hypothetical protein